MAAAERELAAWYQDVGTRVDLQTGGYAGIHRGQVIATGLKCFCGKPTKAVGLCLNHYHSIWRRVHGRITGQRHRAHRWALCRHRGDTGARPHWRYGLCEPCGRPLERSKKFYRQHDRAMADPQPIGAHGKYGPRTIPTCGHPKRTHRARGLCARCYDAWLRRRPEYTRGGRDRASGPVRSEYRGRNQRLMRCGHNGRPYGGHGLCKSCYETQRRERQDAPRATCHPDRAHCARGLCKPCWGKERTRAPAKRTRPAICHPDHYDHGHGLCGACYRLWRKASAPPVHLFIPSMQRRTLKAVRPRGSGKAPARCHPGKPGHGRGLCGACYRLWLKQDRPPLEAFIRRRSSVAIKVIPRKGDGSPPSRCHPDRPAKCHGLCNPCYLWWRRTDRPPLEAFIRRRKRIVIGPPIAPRWAA